MVRMNEVGLKGVPVFRQNEDRRERYLDNVPSPAQGQYQCHREILEASTSVAAAEEDEDTRDANLDEYIYMEPRKSARG